MYDCLIREAKEEQEGQFISSMWENGYPLVDIIKVSKLPFKRIKQILKNHIEKDKIETIAKALKTKKSIEEIANSTQLSPQATQRIVDLIRFKPEE